jgi:hypothetical protein
MATNYLAQNNISGQDSSLPRTISSSLIVEWFRVCARNKEREGGSVNGASRDRKKARERKKRDPTKKRLKNERNGGNYLNMNRFCHGV